MSVRGWVFVATLMSVAVLVKPALKVAWPLVPDPTMSDDTGTVAEESDQADPSDPANMTVAGPDTVVADKEPTSSTTTHATRADRKDQRQFVASDDEKSAGPQDSPVQSNDQTEAGAEPVNLPPAESSTLQSEMADFTRSIARDYAARRVRAMLSPNVGATSVPLEADEVQQSLQRAIDEARHASEAKVAEAEDRLGAEQKRTTVLADQLAKVQSQLATAQNTVGQLRDAVASADLRMDDWHRVAEQAQAEVADTRAALVKATAEASDAREALGRSKTEGADAAAALAQLRSEAAELASRRKDLDGAATARVEEAQQRLAAESKRVADLTRELDTARAQMADADHQKTVDAEQRRALETASKDLDAKLQDERKKNAALAAELAAAQATVRQLQEQAKALQAAAAKPSLPARAKKPEQRGTPEALLVPAKPAMRTAAPSVAVLPRSQDARGDDKTSGPAATNVHVAGRPHRRPERSLPIFLNQSGMKVSPPTITARTTRVIKRFTSTNT